MAVVTIHAIELVQSIISYAYLYIYSYTRICYQWISYSYFSDVYKNSSPPHNTRLRLVTLRALPLQQNHRSSVSCPSPSATVTWRDRTNLCFARSYFSLFALLILLPCPVFISLFFFLLQLFPLVVFLFFYFSRFLSFCSFFRCFFLSSCFHVC